MRMLHRQRAGSNHFQQGAYQQYCVIPQVSSKAVRIMLNGAEDQALLLRAQLDQQRSALLQAGDADAAHFLGLLQVSMAAYHELYEMCRLVNCRPPAWSGMRLPHHTIQYFHTCPSWLTCAVCALQGMLAHNLNAKSTKQLSGSYIAAFNRMSNSLQVTTCPAMPYMRPIYTIHG